MGKGMYLGVDSKAHKVKKMYLGVDGKARKVKKVYIGDANGKARLCWNSYTKHLLRIKSVYSPEAMYTSLSEDGSDWSAWNETNISTTYLSNIWFGNERYVIQRPLNSNLWITEDGVTFTKINLNSYDLETTRTRDFMFADGKFYFLIGGVVSGYYGFRLLESTDAYTWNVVEEFNSALNDYNTSTTPSKLFSIDDVNDAKLYKANYNGVANTLVIYCRDGGNIFYRDNVGTWHMSNYSLQNQAFVANGDFLAAEYTDSYSNTSITIYNHATKTNLKIGLGTGMRTGTIVQSITEKNSLLILRFTTSEYSFWKVPITGGNATKVFSRDYVSLAGSVDSHQRNGLSSCLCSYTNSYWGHTFNETDWTFKYDDGKTPYSYNFIYD